MPQTRKEHSNHDHSGHSHGASRSGELEGVSDSRLLWAVILNQILTVGQVVAGIFSGSVALLSDAAHNFNDANALLIAYIARRISKKDANERYTFGYRRAEMIGALINLTLLAVIGLYLVYEGIMRFMEPQEIIGWLMAATALLALVIDVATALLLWAMSRGSLNVRAAFIHNIVDALGSVAVLLGAGAIIWFDWTWVDPVITLLIASYVLWQVFKMLPQATRVLMEGTPVDLDMKELVKKIEQIDGVSGTHHVHVWELDEQHRALEAHVIIQKGNPDVLESIKRKIKHSLSDEFQIQHSTLEFEYEGVGEDCDDQQVIADH
ncbi:cation diffusion facilitator family transporter [Rubinisphaera italica]|uniref:Cadmium, cobalt and zinc/H(+)-K(+) antiporter n=1 Tax=Rubinisphaera italica TaxID=2527969 RepID=A0A5C5XPH1_9PLAN|nr:cation diffusion facilitator family transporter [Rubinisphaera italica]TWT64351.1 Cadmium, cobalt and zinc/H(+)-K(+) antiporter [Rubinisphaera italica]